MFDPIARCSAPRTLAIGFDLLSGYRKSVGAMVSRLEVRWRAPQCYGQDDYVGDARPSFRRRARHENSQILWIYVCEPSGGTRGSNRTYRNPDLNVQSASFILYIKNGFERISLLCEGSSSLAVFSLSFASACCCVLPHRYQLIGIGEILCHKATTCVQAPTATVSLSWLEMLERW